MHIEVKGGRTVNILLKGGENLQLKDFNKIDVPSMDEELYTEGEAEEVNTEVLGYNTDRDTNDKKEVKNPNKTEAPLIKEINNDKIPTNPFAGLGE